MSERLPYEEQLAQQWNDLSLPDENMAWEDMKRRLEKDDDTGIIPIWLRGCLPWGLLLVVLLGLGWWFFHDPKSAEKTNSSAIKESPSQRSKKPTDTTLITSPDDIPNGGSTSTTPPSTTPTPIVDDVPTPVEPATPSNVKPGGQKEGDKITSVSTSVNKIPAAASKPNSVNVVAAKKKERSPTTRQQKRERGDETLDISTDSPGKKGVEPRQRVPVPADTNRIISKIPTNANNTSKAIDSSGSAKKDTLKTKMKEPVVENVVKTDSTKKKFIYFSGGIALHQLIPIDGQQLTPYSASGRKGSLADYIPSIYFRMYKNEKWFLQGEFRYGAPQYNREIIYLQKSVVDTQGNSATITSTKLKKTFYHQLPVSFNYFIRPNWSVGTGIVWNKFNSAVSEQDIVKRTISTGIDTALSVGTVLKSNRADSNFARSYFQGIIETQYRWKRFSLGARYSFGLQPYLTFKLPGGTEQREKNQSLQVFLRYELWKSKKIYKK